jgi:cation diffusion facilitator family transporter
MLSEDPASTSLAEATGDSRVRLSAAVLSLCVALLLLVAKLVAYRITGSTAVLSDALEAIVNVLAAAFAVGSLVFAGRPADRNHPYGHGKIEFLSAAFEGGLIVFAAVLIFYESVQALWVGPRCDSSIAASPSCSERGSATWASGCTSCAWACATRR